MKKNIVAIKIFVVVITVVFLSSIYVARYWSGKHDETPSIENNNIDNNDDQSTDKPRGERALAISHALKAEEKRIFKLNPTDSQSFVAMAYPKDYQTGDSGGIMVVDITDKSKPIIFWENQSASFSGMFGGVIVQDITDDGNLELISSWWSGPRAFDNAVWLYTFDGKTFIPLPIIDGHGKEPNQLINNSYLDEVVDLDNDGVFELIAIYQKNDQAFKETYKWNGKEYYLWKEEEAK